MTKLFLAGMEANEKLMNQLNPKYCLVSYFAVKNKDQIFKNLNYDADIFLDSGAFSALSQNKKINIKDYILYIKQNKSQFNTYANLDVIGNPEKTLRNQKIMEEAGLKPLPAFHIGTDWKYLEHYCKNYDYIAIGGMVPYAMKPKILKTFLNKIFEVATRYNTKLHGFGLTNLQMLKTFPFYSVDSTSWLKFSIYRTYQIFNGKTIKTYPKTVLKTKFNKNNKLSGKEVLKNNMGTWMNYGKYLESFWKGKQYWEE